MTTPDRCLFGQKENALGGWSPFLGLLRIYIKPRLVSVWAERKYSGWWDCLFGPFSLQRAEPHVPILTHFGSILFFRAAEFHRWAVVKLWG